MSATPESMSTDKVPHHCTPEWVLAPIRRFAGGKIVLDPCSNPDSIVDAIVELDGSCDEQDGLALNWRRTVSRALWRRTVSRALESVLYQEIATPIAFVNPPYTRDIVDKWALKCAIEGEGGLDVVALLPLRPSSQWFKDECIPHSRVVGPAAICMLNKRVKFLGSTSSPSWESCLVYWGPRSDEFASRMRWIGNTFGPRIC